MPEKTTIHGIVIPAVWNDQGEVVSVIVAAYNEAKYLVADSPKGRGLLSLLRKRVVVSGQVQTDGARNVIEVDSFRLDKPPA